MVSKETKRERMRETHLCFVEQFDGYTDCGCHFARIPELSWRSKMCLWQEIQRRARVGVGVRGNQHSMFNRQSTITLHQKLELWCIASQSSLVRLQAPLALARQASDAVRSRESRRNILWIIIKNLVNHALRLITSRRWLSMNIPAILGIFRVIRQPSLCLPHHTVPTFADIPGPIESVFKHTAGRELRIKAIVLDKDNCFAAPNQDQVHPSCQVCTLPLSTSKMY